MHTDFSDTDLQELALRGIEEPTAVAQLHVLRNPPPPQRLVRPATLGDGIKHLTEEEIAVAKQQASAAAAAGRLTKFVPASGAASRMFAALAKHDEQALERFAASYPRFAFAAEPTSVGAGRSTEEVVRYLLDELEYRRIPKGLLPFHRDGAGETRTPFDEHIAEGVRYLRDDLGRSRFHFTVAADWVSRFEVQLEKTRQLLPDSLEVTFSVQHPATDTIAIAPDGSLFRSADGRLLFRPGGHGALLKNLGELAGDIVIIKNIDNVVPQSRADEVVEWKQILTGHLVALEAEAHSILHELDSMNDDRIPSALRFAARLGRTPRKSPSDSTEARNFIREALDRPLRVFGVVRNEGEPGGAPFWTHASGGATSLQIVESSQVNRGDAGQEEIWSSSTHFNPVDLVCTLRNWRGEPFDLSRFVDRDAVFIARKTHDGRDLLALELPGLWNGAMAFWNSVAVEVPASTFAPVKSVFDLLRPEHQP